MWPGRRTEKSWSRATGSWGSDVGSVRGSGQAILQAMILDQQTDPVKLAGLAKGRLPKKKEEIITALQGRRLPPTHRWLLKQGMEHLALWVQQIEELDHQIEQKIQVEGVEGALYESAECSGPEGNGGFRD